MMTPSVSQSSAGAPAAPAAPVASGWMPSRPCSSAMSRSWEGILLRVAGSSRRRGEGSRDMGCARPVSRLLLITERIWGGGEAVIVPLWAQPRLLSPHTGAPGRRRGQNKTAREEPSRGEVEAGGRADPPPSAHLQVSNDIGQDFTSTGLSFSILEMGLKYFLG